jgi:AAA+ ATPase superfamily predicted ATPase
MKFSLKNPFLDNTEESENLFFNRKEEIHKIQHSLKSGKIAWISGLKGIGKTALAYQSLNVYRGKKATTVFYADVNAVSDHHELLIQLARQTLGKLDISNIKLTRELSSYFVHLRAVIRFDGLTGASILDFSLDRDYNFEHTLDQIASYIELLAGDKIIVMDNIQRMAEFSSDAYFIHVLKRFGNSRNLKTMLCSSSSESLNKLLNDNIELINKYTQLVNLNKLEYEAFSAFLAVEFANVKRKFSDEVIDKIVALTRNHTYYTIAFCERLSSNGIKNPDSWYLERLYNELVNQNESVYYTYRQLLTQNQWNLLKAIARENGAFQVLGSSFIMKYNLGSTSSVQTALAALISKNLIHQEDTRWYLSDVFFSHWIKN